MKYIVGEDDLDAVLKIFEERAIQVKTYRNPVGDDRHYLREVEIQTSQLNAIATISKSEEK